MTQNVELNACKSTLGTVEHIVPQGSVLYMYMTLLIFIFMGKIYMYADDIYVLNPYKYEIALKAYMERDAAIIFKFAIPNKLVINSKKRKLLRFCPQLNGDYREFSIFANGDEIFENQSIKYLGVNL